MFCKLCKRDIIDHSERIDNERVTKVGVQWGKLCRVVQECVIVNRQQGYFIGKLTEVWSSGPFTVQYADHDGSAYFLRGTSTFSLP